MLKNTNNATNNTSETLFKSLSNKTRHYAKGGNSPNIEFITG